MTTGWDLFGDVVDRNNIPDTQQSGSRPAAEHILAGVLRSAVVLTLACVFTSSPVGVVKDIAGSTSSNVAVVHRQRAPAIRTVRPAHRKATGSTDGRDFGSSRTAEQLAASFRAMLRPIDPEDDVASEFSFG